MDNKVLAELLFPGIKETVESLIKNHPPRGKAAFRFAPSPTGYLHIGGLGMAVADFMLAKSNGGVNILRIEDTDQKRKVDGAVESLVKSLKDIGITYDEGPFTQSQRIPFYHTFAKRLVENGSAFPCYCDPDSEEECTCQGKEFQKDKPWALRVNFNAKEDERITFVDCVKGEISLPVTTRNVIILKRDGIPPYNFAHVVDDTLMRTSHVVRGEEWLVSTAEHIQLFKLFGLEPPQYAHLPVICIEEDGKKRKLSKRKDREALVENFLADGYPSDALVEYLLTLYNTDYELWRIANPNLPWHDFKYRFEKIGSNSPLFDWAKLNDISKKIIAKKTCAQINAEVDEYFAGKDIDINKVHKILAIDRETEKPRKDIAKYSDIPVLYDYLFTAPNISNDISKAYAKDYNHADTKEEWFARIKASTDNVREYTKQIRLCLTGKENTPDLYAIMQILGEQEVLKRLSN